MVPCFNEPTARYVWHITFFGGCMAVAGYAESQNRHALSCCVVLPKSQSGKNFKLICTGLEAQAGKANTTFPTCTESIGSPE